MTVGHDQYSLLHTTPLRHKRFEGHSAAGDVPHQLLLYYD